jgi:hypothetical protein
MDNLNEHLGPTVCPHCKRKNHFHSNVDGASPLPGDFSICWDCKGIATYDEDLHLVHLTLEQMEVLKDHEDIPIVKAAMHESPDPFLAIELWRYRGRE